jgi:hypothetical protein
VGRLALDLAPPSHRLFFHRRHARAIHLHIHERDRLADHLRQVQLQGLLDRRVLALSDIGADGLRRALHRFGGHLQARQNFHLFAPVIEGGILPYHRLHAAHAGREGCVLDIQILIGGKLARVTPRAPIVGTRHVHQAQGGENGLGTQLPIASLLAASTRKGSLVGGRNRKLQQLGERRCSGPVQGRAHRHLHGFQIQTPGLAARLENHTQELVYFASHFLADRFRRFFSADDSVSSTGRARQILSLTSSNCRLSWRKR